MSDPNFLKSYPEHVAQLRKSMPESVALEKAVGGDFATVGKLEMSLLFSLGLPADGVLVDVGCGSGRLAVQLRDLSGLHYLGTDIVPELLQQARKLCQRPDWRFVLTNGTEIPCEAGSADMVCFFSVFTHLTHEDTFRYLASASRVLKPGGKIVFSFLEFRIDSHWEVFDGSVRNGNPGAHLDQFIDRDGIVAWARHLGLDMVSFFDGDKPHIPIEGEVEWENGLVMRGVGNLGQSVAVLSVPNMSRREASPVAAAFST